MRFDLLFFQGCRAAADRSGTLPCFALSRRGHGSDGPDGADEAAAPGGGLWRSRLLRLKQGRGGERGRKESCDYGPRELTQHGNLRYTGNIHLDDFSIRMEGTPLKDPEQLGVLFAASLFLGMLVLLEIGRRAGNRRLAKDPEGARTGISAVEGSMFGLLGLLIAFTFSGAANRFDDRRELITEEANDIGTAWLRLDLLPAETQPEMRDLFRRYLDSRLLTYKKIPDMPAVEAELRHSIALQREIWEKAVAGVRAGPPGPTGSLLLNSLNSMFDIASTRTAAARMHPPFVIYLMLGALALAAAVLAGFGMAGTKTRSWIHVVGFAAVLSLTVYVILDIEYPRVGLIRVDSFDRSLVELRESMK